MKEFKLFNHLWTFDNTYERKTILETLTHSSIAIDGIAIEEWFYDKRDIRNSLKSYLKKLGTSTLRNIYNKLEGEIK